MANNVTVTVLLDVKPEVIETFWTEILPGLQTETRKFEGVVSVRAVRQDAPSNKILFIDVFESTKAAEDYFDWRTKRGDLANLASMLSAEPEVAYWPKHAE